MNLSIIWDKLHKEDRFVLISVLKHDKWWNRDNVTWNINDETSLGRLVFLDAEDVLESLKCYAKYNINNHQDEPTYKRVKRIIGLIEWKLASTSLADYKETH